MFSHVVVLVSRHTSAGWPSDCSKTLQQLLLHGAFANRMHAPGSSVPSCLWRPRINALLSRDRNSCWSIWSRKDASPASHSRLCDFACGSRVVSLGTVKCESKQKNEGDTILILFVIRSERKEDLPATELQSNNPAHAYGVNVSRQLLAHLARHAHRAGGR